MADAEPAATTFELADWNDLPVSVKRSRKKLYEYIQSVLAGDE